MNEWMSGVERAASHAAPGCMREEVQRAETEAGYEMPEELRALYQRFDGADLPGGVHLYGLHHTAHEDGVLDKSRKFLVGLPASGQWRFGRRGEHQHLFAARKSALVAQSEDTHLPAWAEALEDDAWVYGTWDDEHSESRLFRTLAELMGALLPEVQETVRAEGAPASDRAALEGALEAVGRLAAEGVPPLEHRGAAGTKAARRKKEGAEETPRPVGTARHPSRRLPAAEQLGLTPGGPVTPMPVNPPPIGLEGLTSHKRRARRAPAPTRAAKARGAAARAPEERAPAEAARTRGTGARKAPTAKRGAGAAVTPRRAAAKQPTAKRAGARKTATAKRGAPTGRTTAGAKRGAATARRGATAKRTAVKPTRTQAAARKAPGTRTARAGARKTATRRR